MPKKPAFVSSGRGRGRLVPRGPRKVGRIRPSSGNMNGIIDAAKRAALGAVTEYAFDKAHSIITNKGSKTLKVGNKTVGETPPPTEGTDKPHAKVAIVGKTTLLELGSEKLQMFNRTVETGVPSSKAIKTLAKEQGTQNYRIFDSQNAISTDGQYFPRNILNMGTGFNQKGYTAFGRPSYFTYRDMYQDIIDINDVTNPAFDSDARYYASIMKTKSTYTIRNQSAYHRVEVKAHLCAYQPQVIGAASDPVGGLANKCFWPGVNDTSLEESRNRVPQLKQYNNAKWYTSSTENDLSSAINVDVNPKGNVLGMSPYFRKNYTIVDTQGIILGPGDFFKYNHVHHYGSGVDITALMSTAPNPVVNSLSEHMNYFVIWEYKGLPCEVTYNNAGDFNSYIGTAPVILNSEITKDITYVSNTQSPIDSQNLGGKRQCHVRIFTKATKGETVFDRRDFNLGLNSWSASASPAPGQYVIQVASDRTVRTETHAAGNTGATEIFEPDIISG